LAPDVNDVRYIILVNKPLEFGEWDQSLAAGGRELTMPLLILAALHFSGAIQDLRLQLGKGLLKTPISGLGRERKGLLRWQRTTTVDP
jgi:hypothetical protein